MYEDGLHCSGLYCLRVNVFFISVFLRALVPSTPTDLEHVNSTEDSLTISWKQSGFADNYTIEYNNTKATASISMVGVGDGDSMVSATVTGLATPGALYCLTVAAVSGHLHSQQSDILCSYTGELNGTVVSSQFQSIEDGVLEDCPQPRGQKVIALALSILTRTHTCNQSNQNF